GGALGGSTRRRRCASWRNIPPQYFLIAVPAWWWAYLCSAGDGRGVWHSRASFRSRLLHWASTSASDWSTPRILTAFESGLRKGMPPSQLFARRYRTSRGAASSTRAGLPMASQTWTFTEDLFLYGIRITIPDPRRLERHGDTWY